jgi:hypothetical protein
MSFHRDNNVSRGAGAIAARDARKSPRQRALETHRARQNAARDRVRGLTTSPALRQYALGKISNEDPTGAGNPWGTTTGGSSGQSGPHGMTPGHGTTHPLTPPSRGVFLPGQLTKPITTVIVRPRPAGRPAVVPITPSSPGSVVVSGGGSAPITSYGGGGGGAGPAGGGLTTTEAEDLVDLTPSSSSSTLFSQRNLLIAGGLVAAYLLLRKKKV